MALIKVWHKKTGAQYLLGEQFVAQRADIYTTTPPKKVEAPAAPASPAVKKSARPARRTTTRATEAK